MRTGRSKHDVYTNWAIGLVIAHLARTIQEDQGSVLPVSVRLRGGYGIENVCLSIPVRVGIKGAGDRLQIPLSDDEHRALVDSARTLKENLGSISL